MKPIHKLNNGQGATLCNQCSVIISLGHIEDIYCKECKEQFKQEIEEKNLLEMLHKFGFDYTYNYRGEKTIYEWIPEWFEDYKKLNK